MAKKKFTYRGKTLEELQEMSLSELAPLLPSNSRRKITRLDADDKQLIEKIRQSEKPVRTHKRNMIILPFMVGKTIMVHSGKEFQTISIIDEMIGHRLGEYVLTRSKVAHSSPGIGATRSSAALSVK